MVNLLTAQGAGYLVAGLLLRILAGPGPATLVEAGPDPESAPEPGSEPAPAVAALPA